jgi:hypothetical protein
MTCKGIELYRSTPPILAMYDTVTKAAVGFDVDDTDQRRRC